MINRDKFYSGYRDSFGKLDNVQVSGLETMLNGFDDTEYFNLATQYAGILAQTARETNWTFKPQKEGYWIAEVKRKRTLYNYYLKNNPGAIKTIFPYGWNSVLTYEGRGRTQTTHINNYIAISEALGIDCVDNPDLLLEDKTDIKVMLHGYHTGLWTGKKLTDYINEQRTDYKGQRRVVNGLDAWREIQANSIKFEKIIYFD